MCVVKDMDAAKFRSKIQENLALLYLRLNGFLVTGFIAHSAVQGQALTEIDALGLRMPYSAEPEREVGTDRFLDLSNRYTELVICEAKSRGGQLRFNEALTAEPTATEKVLRWSGLFMEKEVPELAVKLRNAVAQKPLPSAAPPTLIGPRQTRVRCLLFSLERASRRCDQPWFIPGHAVFDYVHRCLSPSEPRACCSTSYDFGLWADCEQIVRYFKQRTGMSPGDMNQLYEALEIGCHNDRAAQIECEGGAAQT